MGAIAGVLLLPFMAPAWGFRFLVERLNDEAQAVLGDEGRNFAELIDLSMRRSAGKISDAEYAEQEALLLERLSSIRDAREASFADDVEEPLDDELVELDALDALDAGDPAQWEAEC